jgi:hypothetical protein
MDTLRQEVLKLVPVNFREWYENASQEDIENAKNYLDGLAQSSTRLSEYLAHRQMGGGHDGAVKAANRLVSKVRKALGYTYYKQDLHF